MAVQQEKVTVTSAYNPARAAGCSKYMTTSLLDPNSTLVCGATLPTPTRKWAPVSRRRQAAER